MATTLRTRLRLVSAGTTPARWLWEWTLLALAVFFTGSGLALVTSAAVVPPLSVEQAQVEREVFEKQGQRFLDERDMPLDIRDPFPEDDLFAEEVSQFWEARRWRVSRELRRWGVISLLGTGFCCVLGLVLRSRRTQTAGYQRLWTVLEGR